MCCTSIHRESELSNALKEHELYHDIIEGELICKKCFNFKPSNDFFHCPYARLKNKLEVALVPEELKFGFMEQRAVALTHIYMSIILIRGHQAAVKGQVVHFHVDQNVIVDDLLPFPRCHEFLAVVQEKPMKNNEIHTTVTYSFSPIQVLKGLMYLKEFDVNARNL